MDRTKLIETPFPTSRAFVVQFGAHSDAAGRVEHVVSGQAAKFCSPEELFDFIMGVLGGAKGDNGETGNDSRVAARAAAVR